MESRDGGLVRGGVRETSKDRASADDPWIERHKRAGVEARGILVWMLQTTTEQASVQHTSQGKFAFSVLRTETPVIRLANRNGYTVEAGQPAIIVSFDLGVAA